MLKKLSAIVGAMAWATAVSATPVTVTRGTDGNQSIDFHDSIVIEGEIRRNGADTKVNCGDCRDGVYTPKHPTQPSPSPSTPPPKTKEQLEQEAKQAFDDAAVLYVRKIRQDEEPLENESMVVKWLLDKVKNKLLPIGPWGTVLDSLQPRTGGISEFDQAKDKAAMKQLREELEAEERKLRQEKEKNAELYEKNMRYLEPKIPADDVERGLASLPELNKMQDALVARAKLRSEDYGVVVQQVLSRTRFDAQIRMPTATYQKVSKEIWRITPSNVCHAPSGPSATCVLYGLRKGSPCFCPNPAGMNYALVKGTATRFPEGSICRYKDVSVDLRRLFPARAQCGIPVNVSINPSMPAWDFLPGQISEK